MCSGEVDSFGRWLREASLTLAVASQSALKRITFLFRWIHLIFFTCLIYFSDMFSKKIYCTIFLLRAFLFVRSRYDCHGWRTTFVTFGMFEIIFGKPSTPFYEWPRKDVTVLPQLLATNRVISTKHQHTLFAFDDALRRRRGARSSSKFRNSRSIGPPRTTKQNACFLSSGKLWNSVLFSTQTCPHGLVK